MRRSEKRKVHNAPWSDCRNKNVFSDHLNREFDNSAFRKSAGVQTVPHSCGCSCKGPVPEAAGGSMDRLPSCQQNVSALLERR